MSETEIGDIFINPYTKQTMECVWIYIYEDRKNVVRALPIWKQLVAPK